MGKGRNRLVPGQTRKQLDTVVSPKSKLTRPVRKQKGSWVEPSFTVAIEFLRSLLRQSFFKGLSAGTRRT
jgi:bifunctional non-homologous end joining protein LigD